MSEHHLQTARRTPHGRQVEPGGVGWGSFPEECPKPPGPRAWALTQTCPRGPVLWAPALCERSTRPLWPHRCSPRPGAGAGHFCPSLGPAVAHPKVRGTEWVTVPSPPRNKGSCSGLSPTHSWALAWRLPLAAGFGIGHGPQGGQEPRSVGLSRSCGVGGPGWGPRDSVSEICIPQRVSAGPLPGAFQMPILKPTPLIVP